MADKSFFDGLSRRYGYALLTTVKVVSGAQVFKPIASMLIE